MSDESRAFGHRYSNPKQAASGPEKYIESDGKALMLFSELLRLGYTADDIKSYAERVSSGARMRTADDAEYVQGLIDALQSLADTSDRPGAIELARKAIEGRK